MPQLRSSPRCGTAGIRSAMTNNVVMFGVGNGVVGA
jgi:hypothetical protein